MNGKMIDLIKFRFLDGELFPCSDYVEQLNIRLILTVNGMCYDYSMDDFDIVVAGGGAAGLAAACSAGQAARENNKQIRICLLERNHRVGKKLYATGNGRCNLSNIDIDAKYYRSSSTHTVAEILQNLPPADVLSFFSAIGLHMAAEEGRIYPYSFTAGSVLDTLRLELERLGIPTVCDYKVERIDAVNTSARSSKYKIYSTAGAFTAKAVIIAVGGKAAPQTGSDGSGYDMLRQLGHTVLPVFPALVPLTAQHPSFKMLKGIRAKPCRITLTMANRPLSSCVGEVLFTEYGLSGIPAMQVSGAVYSVANVKAVLDLLPGIPPHNILKLLMERRELFSNTLVEHFFTGLLHKQLGQALLKEAGVESLSVPAIDLSDRILERLSVLVKNWEFTITGTRGFSAAQVTGGGVSLEEFDSKTMESLKVPGLFAAGEVLDAYGDCGGYNLHWAWTTGLLAGRGAVGYA
jgi:predicted Rossmann fold flavoprotein